MPSSTATTSPRSRRSTPARVDGGVIYHLLVPRSSKTKEISGDTELHYFRSGDPGAFVSLSSGGVLKSSETATGTTVLRFITGAAGQVLQKGTSFEYPVASDVAANPALVPLRDLQPPAVNPSDLNAEKVSDLMTTDGLL